MFMMESQTKVCKGEGKLVDLVKWEGTRTQNTWQHDYLKDPGYLKGPEETHL